MFTSSSSVIIFTPSSFAFLFLPEEDVLLVTDKKIKFIGDKKYCLFYNGKSKVHTSANFKKDINRE